MAYYFCMKGLNKKGVILGDRFLCGIWCEGFKDATTACCASGPYGGVYSCGGKRGIEVYELCDKPGDHFFFDSYHPSEKAYRQFAELMWAGNTDIVWPYNLKMLFQDNAFYP